MNVNADGRRMALNGNYNSAFEACDKYRPAGYDPLDRFKYYKKNQMSIKNKNFDDRDFI